ncbi:MAG: hypothetical protein R3315_06485 [Woeseiaceae bacterium]|nr:hypothetical protein [Woeseiaceae bacterium]
MVSEWLGIPAAFVAWGFALYVFVVSPPTRGARFLVAMLVIDGLAVISSYDNPPYIDRFLDENFGVGGIPWWSIHQASDWAMVAVYLAFIGMTLGSPLVRPLKHPVVRNLILFGGLAIALSMFFLPLGIRQQFRVPFYVVICIVLAWGFAAAIHSWYIATSEATRARARAFTLAFGVRDVLWTFTFALNAAHFYGLVGPGTSDMPDDASPLRFLVPFLYELAVIIYVPLVAYGVLRVQLFDVDLRIKRTLKRSTIAAAFVATFFVVSELATTILSNQLGAVLGVIVAGGLVFFLDPIQRAAERLASSAMPNTHDTPEYETYRKLQVYESAVQAALEDGHISERQRRVLDSMLQSMGIDAKVAEQLENDARAALAR